MESGNHCDNWAFLIAPATDAPQTESVPLYKHPEARMAQNFVKELECLDSADSNHDSRSIIFDRFNAIHKAAHTLLFSELVVSTKTNLPYSLADNKDVLDDFPEEFVYGDVLVTRDILIYHKPEQPLKESLLPPELIGQPHTVVYRLNRLEPEEKPASVDLI